MRKRSMIVEQNLVFLRTVNMKSNKGDKLNLNIGFNDLNSYENEDFKKAIVVSVEYNDTEVNCLINSFNEKLFKQLKVGKGKTKNTRRVKLNDEGVRVDKENVMSVLKNYIDNQKSLELFEEGFESCYKKVSKTV